MSSAIDEKIDPVPGGPANRRAAASKATRKRLGQVALDLFWE